MRYSRICDTASGETQLSRARFRRAALSAALTSVRVIRGCTRKVACGGLNAWFRFLMDVSTRYIFGKNSFTPMSMSGAAVG